MGSSGTKQVNIKPEKTFSDHRPIPVSFIDQIKQEQNISGRKPVPISYSEQIKKSICKIIINEKPKGTGFFIVINSNKYLITCYHVIQNLSNNIIKIEIWDNNKFNFKLNNDLTKIYKNIDVALIDIKELNIKNIDFLNYDINYIDGYS